MDLLLLIPLFLSAFIVLVFLPLWIKKAKDIGLLWDDMNKISKPKVAGSGGIITLLASVASILLYVAYQTFYLQQSGQLAVILALLLVVVFASGIGFIDDLLGWRKGGLSRRSRLLLLALAAIPLMAINAGKDAISFPLLGDVQLGIFYPLLIIPLGVMGATSTYNFLAGYNGLEAGQGVIILSGLALVAYLTGTTWLAFVALCLIVALIAFLVYNRVPARVFPGDSLTYAVGSFIAAMAIIGNFEKVALFFFIPYILETFLKARGRLIKHSFGIPQKDGTLLPPYDKIYGLEHLAIYLIRFWGLRATEKNVVLLLWAFQLFIVISGILIFRQGIFIS